MSGVDKMGADFWGDIRLWATLWALGAYHGINPAMGWLFAVALGMQERSRRAVFVALLPITVGHALSVACLLIFVAVLRLSLPATVLRWLIAFVLLIFGTYRLLRQRHFRWVGMKVAWWELGWWSFLMATAHGAGLMLTPLALCLPQGQGRWGVAMFSGQFGETFRVLPNSLTPPLLATLIHTIGMLMTMATMAWLVYEKLGVALLRRWWLNFDLLWGIALLLAGIITLLM
jgi:hypothetical protein